MRTLNLEPSPGPILSLFYLLFLASQGFMFILDWMEGGKHAAFIIGVTSWPELLSLPDIETSLSWVLSSPQGCSSWDDVHLPYQANAPSLASVFSWIHSTHKSACWNPHHYSRHFKGVRCEKIPCHPSPSTLELGKIHGKNSCIL